MNQSDSLKLGRSVARAADSALVANSTLTRMRVTGLGTETQISGSILDELLTAEQVAELLHLRVSTVEDYARRAILPSIKVGRHRRYLRSHVERAIARLAE